MARTMKLQDVVLRSLSEVSVFDPPDLVDFKLRAAPPLLEIPFTPAPGFPSELNEAIGTLIDTMSLLVQVGKGMQQSADRLAGARLVGTPTDIANQTAWLGHSGRWEQAAWRQLLRRSQTTLNSLQVEAPELYNFELPVAFPESYAR